MYLLGKDVRTMNTIPRTVAMIKRTMPIVLLCVLVMGVSTMPSPVHAAVAFVQDTEVFKSGTAPATTAVFPSDTTSGNLIVVAASWDSCGNAEITDNKSNVYVAATVKQTLGVICSQIFYAENITGGASHTITISATSGTVEFIKVVAHEVSGVATSGALDENASGTSSGASQSIGPVTTTTDGQYIFATASEENISNNNFSASGVFTERETADQTGSWHTQTQDYVQPTAGSISATWTASSGSSASTVQMATFFAAGSVSRTMRLRSDVRLRGVRLLGL